PRGLGDKFLFAADAIGDRVLKSGGVMGHPEVCSALMKDRQDIMVFPGGAHEAVKPARDIYELQWKQRYGFVKLAAKAGYTVVPVASVGPDEYYDHAMSSQALFNSAPVKLLMKNGLLPKDLRPDLVPPIPAGMLGGLLPKPKTTYFAIGAPIDLAQYQGKTLSTQKLTALRRQFATAIEKEIQGLLLLREQERHQDSWLRRLLSA
ncbi:MAG: acyltransferase, partial [Luminiphilus sp.]